MTDAASVNEQRAAIRAFLQRCEVRLSTLHRVAGAFLGGAGLLVVLPLLAKDSFVGPVRIMVARLLHGLDAPTAMLLAVLLTVLALPLLSLYLLFKDVALFYFTGHQLGSADRDVFYPRFIISGLKLPLDDAGAGLAEARRNEDLGRTLMPASAVARRPVDLRAHAYQQVQPEPGADGDACRRDLLLHFTASLDRTLVEEAVKMEFSLARHILRLRVMVLRYIKALLALVTSAAALFAAASALESGVTDDDLRWLAAILIIWAPLAAGAVNLPPRWIFDHAASDDQRDHRHYRNDRELLYFEDRALWLTAAAFVSSCAAAVVLTARREEVVAGDVVLIVVAVVMAMSYAAVVSKTGGWRHFFHLSGA